MNELVVLFSLIGGLQLLLVGWALRVRVRTRHVEQRVGRLSDALALLTDTTESGFRSTSVEIARVAGQASARRRPGRPKSAALVKAARKGTPIHQIAADERMSEGEVHLRLHLANVKANSAA